MESLSFLNEDLLTFSFFYMTYLERCRGYLYVMVLARCCSLNNVSKFYLFFHFILKPLSNFLFTTLSEPHIISKTQLPLFERSKTNINFMQFHSLFISQLKRLCFLDKTCLHKLIMYLNLKLNIHRSIIFLL